MPLSVPSLGPSSANNDGPWKAGVLLGLGGIVGAQAGARLLQQVDARTFHRIFAGVLILLAIRMLLKK